MSKNTNTNNTEKLVTINSKSKEFFMRSNSSTCIVAWTINPVDMKTVKRDYVFSGNMVDGIDLENVPQEKQNETVLEFMRAQCQKRENPVSCLVVKVEGYVVKKEARAELISDFNSHSIVLVEDEQGRQCLPYDYKEQIEAMHAPTVKLVKDDNGMYKLPDNVQDYIDNLNSTK